MNTLLELLGNRLLATSVQTVLLTALVWLLCRYVRRLPAVQPGLCAASDERERDCGYPVADDSQPAPVPGV